MVRARVKVGARAAVREDRPDRPCSGRGWCQGWGLRTRGWWCEGGEATAAHHARKVDHAEELFVRRRAARAARAARATLELVRQE